MVIYNQTLSASRDAKEQLEQEGVIGHIKSARGFVRGTPIDGLAVEGHEPALVDDVGKLLLRGELKLTPEVEQGLSRMILT